MSWFWIRVYYLPVPALMIEPVGVFGASAAASGSPGGQFWRTFGIALLTVLIAQVAGSCSRSRSPRRPARGSSRVDAEYARSSSSSLQALGIGGRRGVRRAVHRGGDLAAVPRPADAQGGVRRRADDEGGDHRGREPVPPLAARPPLDPRGRGPLPAAARAAAPEYHDATSSSGSWTGCSDSSTTAHRRGRPTRRRSHLRRDGRLRCSRSALGVLLSRARRPPGRPRPAAGPRRRAVTAAELRARAERALADGPPRGRARRRLPRARRPPGRARPARRRPRRHRARGRRAPGRGVPRRGRGSPAAAALFDSVLYGDRPATRDQAAPSSRSTTPWRGAGERDRRGRRRATAGAAPLDAADRRRPGRRGRVVVLVPAAASDDRRPLDPANPDPEGAQALARVLDGPGRRRRRRPLAPTRSTTPTSSPARPCWSPRPTSSATSTDRPAPRADRRRPARARRARPGRPRRSASPGCAAAYGSTTRGRPSCADPLYDGLDAGGRRRRRVPGRRGCFRGRRRRAARRAASGVVLLGAGEALSNDQVLRADNAAVALRLLGQDDRLVWYVPDVRRPGRRRRRQPRDRCCPTGCEPGLWLVAGRDGRSLVWRARRLGRARDRAAAGRRQGDRDHAQPGPALPQGRRPGHAAAALRAAARVRAADRLRLGARTRPRHAGARRRPAHRPARARSTHCSARTPRPATDHDLITLATALAELDREVRRP